MVVVNLTLKDIRFLPPFQIKLDRPLASKVQIMKTDASSTPGAAQNLQEKVTTLLRVVIIGAGFGGLEAARALRNAPVHITVIDRNNHHLFQPLLYWVATAGLSPADIC